MRDEQVFRFMAVREPAKKQKKDVVKARTIEYSVTGAVPPLAQQFFAMSLEQRTRDAIRQTAVGFQQSNRYVPKITSLPLDLTLLARWVEDNSAKPLKDLDVPAFVNVAYGQTVADLANGAPFRESAERLAETVFADAMGDANVRRRRDDVVHAIKLLHLLRETAANSNLLKSDETLGEYLGRTVVVISELTRPREQPKDPVITPVPVREPDEVRVRREKLERLAAAHEELTQILSRPEALQSAPRGAQKGKVPGNCDPRIAVLEAHVAQLVSERQDPKKTELPKLELAPREIAARSGLSTTKPEISLSSQSAAILTNETKAVLQELNVDPQKVNPFAMVTLFETQISKLSESVPAAASPRRVIAFGGGHLDAQMFAATYGQSSGQINVSTLPSRIPCQYKAGLGDLLIVRQKLKAYELAEFAHVENVLMGETREREHRRLNLREEITTVESERETEKERDLQSTERNEMQNEASKTVQSQFQLEAGLQVSGSYGPAVSFSASLNTGFSTSTEETQRKAVTYSREVTDKTSERIRERVREERRVRVLEQVEEINSHKLQNTDAPKGHIRGIYRWLNKIYDAQVFNYGQRMMYEFVVPEPAAYFLYAMIENPPNDLELEKPEPPKYGTQPLKPENLTRTNYQQYLALYKVTTAKAPPASFTNVAYFEKQEGREESHYQRASKVTIPDGYEATSALTAHYYAYANDDAELNILVGSHVATTGWVQFGSPFRHEISVGVEGFYVKAFVVTIDINCRLTAEGFAKWQHETYAAILEAYLNLKATYEEKLAAAEIQRGPQILGRNPIENRRLERDELKKLVLMMLMQSPYLDINSYYNSDEPFMNIGRACANGSYIRFFENAFEWHNMTYVFYPYFWNRHARWASALHLTDPDLEFAAFLRAGAARVQVPVRPNFERAVAYFCQTGEVWEGNDVPLIGDDLYVPIVEEITEKLGKLDEGVPYPPDSKPWEVTVPTSLVVVQNLDEIPNIRDILTGNPIKLLPPNA